MIPFGSYRLTIQRNGFTTFRATVDINSALPLERRVVLAVAGAVNDVRVTGVEPLVDLNAATSAIQIGSEDRATNFVVAGALCARPRRLPAWMAI